MSVVFQQLIYGGLLLMCSNEVLQLFQFNLLGIELDVPPVFRDGDACCFHTSVMALISLLSVFVDGFMVQSFLHSVKCLLL